MNLNISGHHLEMTQSLRDHVESKMERIKRHFDHLIDADVILTVEKSSHRAEITMNVRGNKLHAQAAGDDMYTAINTMVDKLDRQTRRHKDKAIDQRVRNKSNSSLSSG